MIEIIGISLLAAIFELDVTAFGQIMISRPIFAGPVVGYILGDVVSGFWIGVIVELMWINAIPMGTSIPHDVTVISILTTVWGIKYMNSEKSAIILAMALSLPLGILFRIFDVRLRFYNSKIARWIEEGIKKGKEKRIELGIYSGLILFYFKAFIFYLVLIYPGQIFLKEIFNVLPFQIKSGLEVAWYLLPAAGLSIVLVNACYGKLSCMK
ncbi:MAG: PTS sugar transporter subunit IIC [Elusimicrobia bacterium]|nr:PTS sugar transporter subunit IIC [Elusimicrobiota bacterium]